MNETPGSPVGAAGILRTALRAAPVWGIAALIFAAAEVGARTWLGDDGTWAYWDRTTAAKVRQLQRLHEQARPPDLLVVGDSSAAFDIVPERLDAALGTQSYNLGTPGNYARSFDVVMTRGLLPSLPSDPDLLVVSFAGHGFKAEALGQTRVVLASPIARRELGERVWGDLLALVRIHHVLRLRRDPPVHPAVLQQRGFEPYALALDRRRRQPALAARLPPPPAWLVRPAADPPPPDEDALAPLDRLFAWAEARDLPVVLVTPPADDRAFVDEMHAVAEARGVPHLDYADADYPQHNSHLALPVARAYTTRLAEDLRARGLWPPR